MLSPFPDVPCLRPPPNPLPHSLSLFHPRLLPSPPHPPRPRHLLPPLPSPSPSPLPFLLLFHRYVRRKLSESFGDTSVERAFRVRRALAGEIEEMKAQLQRRRVASVGNYSQQYMKSFWQAGTSMEVGRLIFFCSFLLLRSFSTSVPRISFVLINVVLTANDPSFVLDFVYVPVCACVRLFV
jgi:hypothetical protein